MVIFTSISLLLVEEHGAGAGQFFKPRQFFHINSGKGIFLSCQENKTLKKKKKMHCSNSEFVVIQNFHPLFPQTSSAK